MVIAKTQRQLAASLGKSQPAINKWLKHRAWPFGQSGPWNPEEVRAWAERTLGPGAAAAPAANPPAAAKPAKADNAPPAAVIAPPDDPFRQLDPRLRMELYLKNERAKLLKFNRELQEGKYVLRSDVDQERLARIQAVRSALDQLPRVAPRLVGMTEAQIETVLAGEITKICHAFSRQPENEAAPG